MRRTSMFGARDEPEVEQRVETPGSPKNVPTFSYHPGAKRRLSSTGSNNELCSLPQADQTPRVGLVLSPKTLL